MEQVFKTKWVPDWQYVGMGVAILVVIVIFFGCRNGRLWVV